MLRLTLTLGYLLWLFLTVKPEHVNRRMLKFDNSTTTINQSHTPSHPQVPSSTTTNNIIKYFYKNWNKPQLYSRKQIRIKSLCSGKFWIIRKTTIWANLDQEKAFNTKYSIFELNRAFNYVFLVHNMTNRLVCLNRDGELRLVNHSDFYEGCLFEIKCDAVFKQYCEFKSMYFANSTLEFNRGGQHAKVNVVSGHSVNTKFIFPRHHKTKNLRGVDSFHHLTSSSTWTPYNFTKPACLFKYKGMILYHNDLDEVDLIQDKLLRYLNSTRV